MVVDYNTHTHTHTHTPLHSAGYYVKVMKKVQDKGDEYVTKETDRLGRLLRKYIYPIMHYNM